MSKLNERVREVLRQLGGSDAVLAHYRLVGVNWFGQDPEQPLGPTALANTTMETYLQQLPQGCTTCHAYNDNQVNPVPPGPPMQYNSGFADRSFIFQQIEQYTGACSAQQAAKCSAWAQGCPAQ